MTEGKNVNKGIFFPSFPSLSAIQKFNFSHCPDILIRLSGFYCLHSKPKIRFLSCPIHFQLSAVILGKSRKRSISSIINPKGFWENAFQDMQYFLEELRHPGKLQFLGPHRPEYCCCRIQGRREVFNFYSSE